MSDAKSDTPADVEMADFISADIEGAVGANAEIRCVGWAPKTLVFVWAPKADGAPNTDVVCGAFEKADWPKTDVDAALGLPNTEVGAVVVFVCPNTEVGAAFVFVPPKTGVGAVDAPEVLKAEESEANADGVCVWGCPKVDGAPNTDPELFCVAGVPNTLVVPVAGVPNTLVLAAGWPKTLVEAAGAGWPNTLVVVVVCAGCPNTLVVAGAGCPNALVVAGVGCPNTLVLVVAGCPNTLAVVGGAGWPNTLVLAAGTGCPNDGCPNTEPPDGFDWAKAAKADVFPAKAEKAPPPPPLEPPAVLPNADGADPLKALKAPDVGFITDEEESCACCPNAEGCPKADVAVVVEGCPKADAGWPKAEVLGCPNTLVVPAPGVDVWPKTDVVAGFPNTEVLVEFPKGEGVVVVLPNAEDVEANADPVLDVVPNAEVDFEEPSSFNCLSRAGKWLCFKACS